MPQSSVCPIFAIRMQNKYPAKILLFGEYSVINGSPALAIPFYKFSGHWSTGQHSDPRLLDYLRWLKENNMHDVLDLDLMSYEFNRGTIFLSDIPNGYGLGSSGALVAATWDKYSSDSNNIPIEPLRLYLARMESYFHGQSSGLDPLISLLQSPVEKLSDGSLLSLDPIQNDTVFENLYLLDALRPRNTSSLVAIYQQKLTQPEFKNKINTQLTKWVHNAITALKHQSYESFQSAFTSISRFQFEHFIPMIPSHILPLWQDGLNSNAFHIKLCGAGGGGFFLIHCRDTDLFPKPFYPYLISLR